MTCPTCGTDNPAGKRFCGDCGTTLAAVCDACGATNPPGKRFCGDCGLTLGGAPASTGAAAPVTGPVAERRLVSVLFADLVGFTPFAEERDSEDVRETLTRYFAISTEVITRYGGTVEKFIGDAVMAVWGAPTAREDDAERAVRAALELVDAVHVLGSGIQARAGVMTGEAAVTIGATNEGMVAGDLVNTAARVQSVAPPGAVLTGEATMRAASAAIAFEDAGDHVLKGKSGPLATWRALRVVAQRGGHGRSDLPEPPFVGRDEELRLLKDLIASARRDRRTRLVSITGPGGIGKSRLAWEVEKYIDGIAESVYWHRGRSPSYGDGITFWALGEIVRRRAGLAEDDDDAETRRRIHETVEAFIPDDADRAWVEPALLTLLGLEPAPAGGRDVLFAAWRIFFERIAEQGPVILLFEDLQWADSGLLDFIEHLLEWSKGVPILVITLARPELFDRRPDWGTSTRHLTRLALEPLTDDAMRALLDGFVPGLPAAAVDVILARADGMPLYAVETVRALVADGRLRLEDGAYRPVGELGQLAIPDTLRSLIASRLDALDPADRSLVADAAVLGHSFTPAGLAAVSGLDTEAIELRLRALVRRELFDVDADPRSPERGQVRFVQSLIREVAYGTLARRDRRTRHLAAARYFEALGDDELAGALASHYMSAHGTSEPGPEADAVAIQARLALSGAAERAVALGAHDQAVAYLASAIAITQAPAERVALLLRAAQSSDVAARPKEAEVLVRQALALTDDIGDPVQTASAQTLLGEILINGGNAVEAVQILQQAAALLPEDAPPLARASLFAGLSRAHMRCTESLLALQAAEVALDLAERHGFDRLLADTLNNKGSSLGYLGRRQEAIALLAAAVDVARNGGFVDAEIRARNNLGATVGQPRRALESSQAAEQLAVRVGNRGLANWGHEQSCFFRYLLAEDWDLTLDPWRDAGAAAAVSASPFDEVRRLSNVAWLLVARGEPAEDIVATIETLAAGMSDSFASESARYFRAELTIRAGGDLSAGSAEMLAAGASGAFPFLLYRALHYAVAARDRGQVVRVADALHDLRAASDGEAVGFELAARAALDALDGHTEEAADGYRRALAALRAWESNLMLAQVAIDVTIVLPGHPLAVEAAAEARPILERVGAAAWLAELDAHAGAEATAR